MSADRSRAWSGALAWGSLRREGTLETTQDRGPACPDPQAEALLPHGSPELGGTECSRGDPGAARPLPRGKPVPQTTAPAHQPQAV